MKITRRRLLVATGLAGGGIALGFHLSGGKAPWPHRSDETLQPNAFLEVDREGEVTFRVHKAEMGQGVITGLLTLVGEELELDPSRIRYRHAGVHPDFAGPGFPLQLTAGSTSIASNYLHIRQAAATLRELLLAAAAADSGLPAEQLRMQDGAVVLGDSGRRVGFGPFIETARQLPVPEDVTLKPESEFRWVGRFDRRVDNRGKIDGSARYAMDARTDDVLSAVVVRCPHIGGTLKTLDDSAARERPGVVAVVPLGGSRGVGVVATSYWRARGAADALQIEWSEAPALDSDSARQEQRALLTAEDTRVVREDGEALNEASATLEAEYYVPYLAHAAMEPLNAVARVEPERVVIDIGSQGPDLARAAIARALGRPESQIEVRNHLLGGGFGRRAGGDEGVEAALLSAAVGRPVQLIWSREDDMRHDFYRPAIAGLLRARVNENGDVAGWYHRIVGPSITAQFMPGMIEGMLPEWVPGLVPRTAANIFAADAPATVEGAKELPYGFGAVKVEYTNWDPGLPVGYWRSVGHSHTAFVVESFIDELAAHMGRDPLEFRLAWLEEPRHRATLERVAREASWGNPPPGRFQGLAVHESFGTVAAQVAEISIEGDSIRVHKVVCALHCGRAINPDIVAQQVEGAVIYGLSAALHGRVTLSDGAVEQGNFDDYPVLRMGDAPVVETYILDSTDAPTGVGEPGLPPAAPAVANAVFAATGKRLRELPLTLSGSSA